MASYNFVLHSFTIIPRERSETAWLAQTQWPVSVSHLQHKPFEKSLIIMLLQIYFFQPQTHIRKRDKLSAIPT